MIGSRVRTRAGRALLGGARPVSGRIVLAAMLILITCAGCGASGPGGGVAAAAASTTTASVAAPVGCSDTKVSANSATIEDLTAAFEGAGIPRADRWAEEVDEYRPYPDDPGWAKLQKELGKYNIDPAIYDAILSCLKN